METRPFSPPSLGPGNEAKLSHTGRLTPSDQPPREHSDKDAGEVPGEDPIHGGGEPHQWRCSVEKTVRTALMIGFLL